MSRPRKPANPFRYFHSSPEVIRLVVMMYVRFPLSLRNVEDLLFERGIDICHETVRLWWNRFGPLFAADIRRQRVSRMRGFRHWRWHLDEVYVKISGEMHYLWRAVDHEGEVLESYVTKTRDKSAALRFMRKALKRHGRTEAIVTDGLKSYPAAMRELGNEARREVGRHANNRAENSHLPFRRRERAMQRFRQMKSLQKFASVHGSVYNHFNQERHLVDRQTYTGHSKRLGCRWRKCDGYNSVHPICRLDLVCFGWDWVICERRVWRIINNDHLPPVEYGLLHPAKFLDGQCDRWRCNPILAG